MRADVRKLVADMGAKGITEPATGPGSTPIIMVRKANAEWRLCCACREVKKYVQIFQQPIPRTGDILAWFHGKRYYSVMDMCSGFYQIEISKRDRPKTSFATLSCQRQ